ncbi:zinc finger protein GLIS2 homolog [Drosophila tropicalis]|uniref:zinc finger protein GLIS2 homolog n=1 Tax=Drosophila tropicalis TaxID=46794 RepID=UPI0035ABB44A
MDIVVQKSMSIFNSYEPPVGYYTPYNTPPYITPYTESSWLTEQQQQQQQHQQMQHIRFPTPPITPPRPALFDANSPTANLRTQSVIMKVQSPSISISPEEDSNSNSSSSECSDFICNWLECGRIFETLEALAQHVTQRHAIASLSDGLYYCRWQGCQRSERGFNARYKMLVHTRTHTKEKPHRCHLCEKSFSRAENLKIHIRSHSGEKPYKCNFEGCQKAYSNSSDRFKHTRTHSMEKPYMCKVIGCQKRYTDPSSLRKHVKTFKHSIQLIASQPLSLPNHQAIVTSPSPLEASEATYTCLLPPALSVESSSSLYMDATQSSPDVPSDYSLKHRPTAEFTSSYYLQSEDYYMHMDGETPLDLSMHRS